MTRHPAARERTQDELEQLAFETGGTIEYRHDLPTPIGTLRMPDGVLLFARLSRAVR